MNRSTRPSRRAVAIIAAATTALALVILPAGAASAGNGHGPGNGHGHGSGPGHGHGGGPGKNSCEKRSNNTVDKLLECVTADGVTDHLEAFQTIADRNGGNRAANTPGYEASVGYVVKTLKKAGWKVTIDEFDYAYQAPSQLEQLTPVSAAYESEAPAGTGAGDVTGTIIPVDLVLGQPNATPVTSACEAEDFAGLDFSGPNDVALVQRGTCEFGIKAANAQAAGAEAVIIMNQGNAPDRSGVLTNITLIGANPDQLLIPVVGASYDSGAALAEVGSTARVFVPAPENRPQKNVIAELPGKNKNNVVMAGAHLDSVPAGPGINDNGSGSAALIELAQNLSKHKPENTIRLAWWGAEEEGLLGSAAYVDGLPQAERDRIALYLNFDMIGSPNYIFMIYDGDESGFEAPVVVPEGSVQIEDLFESYFTSVGEPYDDAEFSGRSDYEAFILAGIPAGGLFTGAEEIKSDEQAAIWGGSAGIAFDPCYHAECDTIANIDPHALEVNSDAIALSVLAYSYSTESVNGVKGKKIPGGLKLPPPAGPELTWSAGGGGFSHGPSHALIGD